MQEAEEQGQTCSHSAPAPLLSFFSDTCRICSAPEEPDQPLFHPCKCSGTIRYIHQDWCAILFLCQVTRLILVPVLRPGLPTARRRLAMFASTHTHLPRVCSSLFNWQFHCSFFRGWTVYAPNMPSTLPPVLLLKRLMETMLFGLLFVMRAMAVAAIWLGVLPWVTVWTWRMYFSLGESASVVYLHFISCCC
jgi:E3 ubiquitin-protein ligase MARCH6